MRPGGLLAFTVLAVTTTAPAQPAKPPSHIPQTSICGQHDFVVGRLEHQHKEERRAVMLTQQGVLVELFASRDGSKWSIIATSPRGLTCFSGVGGAIDFFPSDEGDPS